MARVLVAGKYQLLKKIGAGSFGKIFWGVTPPRPPIPGDPSPNAVGCRGETSLSIKPGGVPGEGEGEPASFHRGDSTLNTGECRGDSTLNTGECMGDSTLTSEGGFRGGTPLAIKIMSITHSEIFKNEVSVYEKLREIKGIPELFASGIEGKFSYIVMDLLEQSLEQVFLEHKQMPLNVVLHLALQMLTIIEDIHARGILHRDLKPANFLLKKNKHQISELYLIDFGLAKCFLDEKERHCTLKTNEPIVGTLRYMSINIHQGLTASRRDDLESLGYIILFLYQGYLSWQGQPKDTIGERKQKLTWMDDDAVGNNFILFIRYCRTIGFADKPQYDYLRGLLENVKKLT
jgi:serine/threonine protein kinase